MKKKKFVILIFTIAYLIYILLFPKNGMSSMSASIGLFFKFITIVPAVCILSALIEAFVPKEVIDKNLGNSSGGKGIFFSMLMGSICVGPIVTAFPISKTLFNRGASVKNIVIILSASAVTKISTLAFEAQFLGFKFMITRWILTLIVFIVISNIINKIIKREDIGGDLIE